MIDILSAEHYRDDKAARAYLEKLRWPDGPVCASCGTINRAYVIKPHGTYRCAEVACQANFTVTMNTPMERSRIALHKWLQAFHLVCSSKKGISAHQMHRLLGITYRSSWFMMHRIRECMRHGALGDIPPLGGTGKTVEADETYFGNVAEANRKQTRTDGTPFLKKGKRGGPANKRAVVALVERGGNVRSFHVDAADKATVARIVTDNVHHESALYTDESRLYHGAEARFATHKTVKHSHKEYSRHEKRMVDDETFVTDKIHTNTIEGVFSIFKRGMKGVYQHCDEKHLHRYLAEFDFRYNTRIGLGVNDGERAALAILAGTGKRLTYRQTD